MARGEARPYRRTRVLVNRPLQLAFVKAMVLVLIGMALAALLAVFLALQMAVSAFELYDEPLILSLFRSIFWLVVLELLVLTPLVIWFGVVLMHKVAGPLVRIHAALTQMAEGRYDVHLKMRQGDALPEVTDAVNRLAAALRSRRS